MVDILQNWLEPIISALLGGGLVAIFTVPEKKRAAKIENAQKIIDEYANLILKYREELDERDQRIDALQARIEELEAKSISDKQTRDNRIAELEQQVRDLENTLASMQTKRNSRGQFVKRNDCK